MPNSKVIDSKYVTEFDKVSRLAYMIKRRHRLINQQQDLIKRDKEQIVQTSTDLFMSDINKDVPELIQNHEYHTKDGTVTVNFKLQSRPMTMIKDMPADVYLKENFGDDVYPKLFKETITPEVTSTLQERIEQAKERPEQFGVSLRGDLTPEEVRKIVKLCPECLTVFPKNMDEYAVIYPNSVKKEVSVKAVGGFIEAVDKLSGVVKTRVKKFLVSFIKPALTAAVLCGNASK